MLSHIQDDSKYFIMRKTRVLYATTFVSLIGTLLLADISLGNDTILLPAYPPQSIEVPFRLFRSENIWNQLLLDTRNGRVWQVSYGVKETDRKAKIPINLTLLATGPDAMVGRFTLYPTDNMWNFILVDQMDGRVWQCQFSVKPDERFLLPIRDAE